MNNYVETDTHTWIVTGTHTCDVHACNQHAAIIADVPGRDRFCIHHSTEAAGAALSYPTFSGWYRITASHQDGTQVLLTVHPLY